MVKSGELLVGQYQAKVTQKVRLAFPKKLRRLLGKRVIVTRGYDGCLLAMSYPEWQKLTHQLGGNLPIWEASRETSRFLLGNAAEAVLDSQGRFVLPAHLRQYSHIGKEVVFLGLNRYVEIWDAKRWQHYQRYLSRNIKTISEKLAHE